MDQQQRRYSAVEAARMIGRHPDSVVHYARRYGISEHRPGQRYRFTEDQVEELRAILATPRAHQPQRTADNGR